MKTILLVFAFFVAAEFQCMMYLNTCLTKILFKLLRKYCAQKVYDQKQKDENEISESVKTQEYGDRPSESRRDKDRCE